MEKNYDHNGSEDKIYENWESAGVMRADENSAKKSYTIPLPPPNVTGQLHLGHAAMLAVEDILIRYKKMTGHEVLWLPGTDHAAIATENVVLKYLEIKSREEMSREGFLGECRKFATEKHDRIVHQIKKMGAHLDWSREAYTFDRERNFSVNWIFKKLADDGLITRGHRMINWSVGAQSVLADDEVEWEDNEEDFYEFWCGPFILGTVRAETKCADSPVMVHPTAEYVRAKNAAGRECVVTKKYFNEHTQLRKDFEITEIVPGKKLEGMKFEAETYAGTRKFWVVADEVIDPEFGTGAMTISASHSSEDFALAQKYDLELIQKIDFKGKMTAIAGLCEGLSVAAARKKAGEIMVEKSLLFQKRPHANRVPKCYRSGTVVEPMLSPQWFISVNKEFVDKFSGKKTTLCKLTADAVRDGNIKIVPKRFEKTYFQWTDNLRDWCISRQIWWGHRIPVWYDEAGKIFLPEKKSVIFARHGESQANVENVIGGDFSLTESGRRTAEEIFEQVKDRKISKIICSNLKRGKETAELVAGLFANNTQIEVWPELDEFCSTELAQKSGANFRRVSPIQINFDELKDESLDQIRDRAQSVFSKLQNETGEVLVIGHKNITAALFHFSRSDDTEKFVRFRKNWEWRRGESRDFEFLQDPRGNEISFFRHGESEWNVSKKVQGQHSGIYLTEKGKSQARDAAKKLAYKNFEKIICSDLERAIETAEILRTELGISPKIEIWPELREWGLGAVEGKNLAEAFGASENFPYDAIARKIEAGELDSNAENLEQLEARAHAVFAKLKKEKNALVVSHGGFLGILQKIHRDGSIGKLQEFFKTWKKLENLQHFSLEISSLTQDEDTLDTWFSSALWPFSTLGWPDESATDFQRFYPNDVLETGHDILTFWVLRMVMFGRYATGKCPFHTVYLHGLVCDEHGQKMSKTKGNGIDPLEVISEVGADAVRLSLVIGATPGNPIPLGKSKVSGYRNFVNKLWNAGRFVQFQLSESENVIPSLTPKNLSEKWLLHRFSEVCANVSQKLKKYEISAAGDEIYHFVWDEFCNWFVETSKVSRNPAFLYGIFLEILKLAHPLVPFVTEKLWQDLAKDDEFLIEKSFPAPDFQDKKSVALFAQIQMIVTELRKVRAEKKLPPREKISIHISAGKSADEIAAQSDLIAVLGGCSTVKVAEKISQKPEHSVTVLSEGMEIFVEIPFDAAAEKTRLTTEISTLEKSIVALESRLKNKNYIEKAPASLVAETKSQLEKNANELQKLREQLSNL
ncbi:class I tRNA ligase family protein [bacterium]|jgi:valyl-tRNA synthetase|nr:class I tRNA ligase family protein [bacterium]MBT6995916.1 class I tRNA ligase family protein [bacterium]MBT7772777.1 class I tRNA ligase family protein [bacterium]